MNKDFLTAEQREAVEFMKKFQSLGYAVVVITPEELRDADPREIEYHMISEGTDMIDYLTEE